jgi:hypothetical protein
MFQLLAKPTVLVTPFPKNNRRLTFDRRRSLSSLIDMYRWLSAVTLKLGAALLIILIATWWQKAPTRASYHGALSGEAVYRWDGFHRIHRPAAY